MFENDFLFPKTVITQSVLAPKPAKAVVSKININAVKELCNIIDKSSKSINRVNKKALQLKIKQLQKTLQAQPNRIDIKLEILELQKELRKK